MAAKLKNSLLKIFKQKRPENVKSCDELVKLEYLTPDLVLRNETSWENCFIYETREEPELDIWLNRNKPTKIILNPKNRFDWIAVFHPNCDVEKFQRENNRVSDVPPKVRRTVKNNLSTIQHGDLLTLAVESNIFGGMWLLYFKYPHLWDNCFMFLSVVLYSQALMDKDFSFIKLEAVWDYENDRGVIMLFNDDFTDLETVNELGILCRKVLQTLLIDKYHTSSLCYRPQFYMDVSLKFEFYDFKKSHIFIKHLFEPADDNFKYDVGVEEWFIAHNKAQKKFESKLREIEIYGSF